jgi:hypothetical protein
MPVDPTPLQLVARLKMLLDHLHEGDNGSRPDRDFLPRTLYEAQKTLHDLESSIRRGLATPDSLT